MMLTGDRKGTAKGVAEALGFEEYRAELRPEDKVAIVVYAGAAGLVLPSTSGADKQSILDAVTKVLPQMELEGEELVKLFGEGAEEN